MAVRVSLLTTEWTSMNPRRNHLVTLSWNLRHNHMEANKQGTPAPDKVAGETKNPVHEHAKENKQQ